MGSLGSHGALIWGEASLFPLGTANLGGTPLPTQWEESLFPLLSSGKKINVQANTWQGSAQFCLLETMGDPRHGRDVELHVHPGLGVGAKGSMLPNAKGAQAQRPPCAPSLGGQLLPHNVHLQTGLPTHGIPREHDRREFPNIVL